MVAGRGEPGAAQAAAGILSRSISSRPRCSE